MIKLNLCAIYDFTTQNDGYKQTGARKWLTVPACWCFSFFSQISSDEQLLARRSYLTPGISSNSQQTDRIYRKRGDDKHVIQQKNGNLIMNTILRHERRKRRVILQGKYSGRSPQAICIPQYYTPQYLLTFTPLTLSLPRGSPLTSKIVWR